MSVRHHPRRLGGYALNVRGEAIWNLDAVKRQADVEVYVRDCPLERVLDWARSNVGALRGPFHMDTTTAYHIESGEGAVVLTPSIEGGPFMSVWFNTPSRPWATDVECARAAVTALACVVRCDPGESIPGVSPYSDMWLELDGSRERVIHWEEGDA